MHAFWPEISYTVLLVRDTIILCFESKNTENADQTVSYNLETISFIPTNNELVENW